MNLEPAGDNCFANLCFQLRSSFEPDVQFRVEHPVGAAAHFLGGVECKIGKSKELDCFTAVVRSDCNSHARAAHDVLATNMDRLTQYIDDSCGGVGRRLRLRDLDQYCKFIASESGDGI